MSNSIYMIDRKYQKIIENVIKAAALPSNITTNTAVQLKYQLIGDTGIALIPVHGVLRKHTTDTYYTSTLDVKNTIKKANNDPNVKSILLHIDSPGGTVSGVGDLADYIKNNKKQINAYCEDLTASAAYWVASQCGTIYSSPHTLIGSLGTYTVIYDMSEMYEKEGIKTIVIRSSALKAPGIPGEEVQDAQIASIQREVMAINDDFMQSIQSSRGQIIKNEAYTGQVYLAPEALELGLVDKLLTFEDTITDIISNIEYEGDEIMTVQEKIEKIKYVAEDISPEILASVTDETVIEDTIKSYLNDTISTLKTELSTKHEENEKIMAENAKLIEKLSEMQAEKEVKESAPAPIYFDVVEEKIEKSAKEELLSIANEYMINGMSRQKAWLKAISNNPNLNSKLLAEANKIEGEK